MSNSQSTILNARTNRPIPPNLLEVERGVKWVRLQKLEILVRDALDTQRQLVVSVPKLLGSVMNH